MATRERTRTKLLDAADHLLFTRGIAATPVDAILARAGASPATLYRAYGSKEALVAATLERRHAAWLEVWDAAVAAAPDDRGRLLAVLDALETFRARPDGARWCAFLGTAAEAVDPPAELATALARDTASLTERLGAFAEPVTGRADVAADLAADLLLVVTGHLAMHLRDAADPAATRRVAETLVDAHTGRTARP